MNPHNPSCPVSACRAVGQKYNMPMELAFDLCTLALYDVAIYADDSTSMKYAEGACNQISYHVNPQVLCPETTQLTTVAQLCM